MLGPLFPEKLGFTQCHEHLMLSKGVSYECNPSLWMDDIEASVKEVTSYREMGGAAFVEAQPGAPERVARVCPAEVEVSATVEMLSGVVPLSDDMGV